MRGNGAGNANHWITNLGIKEFRDQIRIPQFLNSCHWIDTNHSGFALFDVERLVILARL